MRNFLHDVDEMQLIRALCGALAVIVIVDAVSVGAPGLALLAVPFVIGAYRFRRGNVLGTLAIGTFALLFAVLGINYAVSNGFDAGWGDLLFAYLGTPIALAIAGFDVHHRLHAMHEAHATA
jgi:hypothetical protein